MKKLYTLFTVMVVATLLSTNVIAQLVIDNFNTAWPPIMVEKTYRIGEAIPITGGVATTTDGQDLIQVVALTIHMENVEGGDNVWTKMDSTVVYDGSESDSLINSELLLTSKTMLSADVDTANGDLMLCQVRAYYSAGADVFQNLTITDSIAEAGTSSIASITSSNLTVYPNPVVKGADITIENAEFSGIVNVQLFNVVGQLVETVTAEGTQVVIPTSELNSGIYFMEVENNDATSTQKILVK